MKRRAFLGALLSVAADAPRPPRVLLCGDSEAFMMAPAFREQARAHGVPVKVDGRGGTSARQWRKNRWLRAALKPLAPHSVVLISLGVNCTRVERPELAREVSRLVLTVNDAGHAPAWLLPPPLKMRTDYLRAAVAASEVFSIDPGPLPLFDGIHPTPEGFRTWAALIAHTLWE